MKLMNFFTKGKVMLNKIEKILSDRAKNRNIIALEDFPEPVLLPGVKEAAKRIIELLDKSKKILIVGDYDCDGIVATSIMIDFFKEAGFGEQVNFIIPDRFIDGYGVSNSMVDYAIENLFDCIVTVDNGIGANQAIKYARNNNIEVIITDHHTPPQNVPEVDIIVNPKYKLGDFPFMEISGATVAWYVCAQIREELDAPIDMREWLDLVGITAISDVMPLKSLNVTLVNIAVNAIKSGKRYVYDLAFDDNKKHVLTETDIGFGFVPMINAIGRLDNAKRGVEMLVSKDKSFIKKTFNKIQDINNQRKLLNEELLKQIEPLAQEQVDSGKEVIVIFEINLHEGIVGILAGKLAEKYQLPAYVFTYNTRKNIWKGSARTYGDIHLYDLTNKANEFILGFGGHKGACGVAINSDKNAKRFKECLQQPDIIDKNKLVAKDQNIYEVDFSNLDQLMNILDKYRPYGNGFPEPIFTTEAFINVENSYKNNLHWKCNFIDQSGILKNGWFFHDKKINEVNQQNVNILYSPVRNYYMGESIQLHAKIDYSGLIS